LDKIKGGLYGVAVGDALGATLEFMDQQQIKQKYGQLSDIIGGGWLNLAPGEWTDDTEMTLAVAEGVLMDPYAPTFHVGERFLAWLNTSPPDVGNTISAAHLAYLNLKDWHKAALSIHDKGMQTAGNGALMRTLPVAFMYREPADIYKMSMAIARLTHWDPEAGLTCFLYCLLVRDILNGTRDKLQAWHNARDKFLSHTARQYAGEAESLIWLAFDEIQFRPKERLKPSGYTVDSLACALWCFFRSKSFAEALVGAVNLGGDADTIGAITGGLAGVYWGYKGIPERWLTKFSSYQVARLDSVADAFKKVKFVG